MADQPTARERIEIMMRTDRSSMTVWSLAEVRDALDAYEAEHRDQVLTEAAEQRDAFLAQRDNLRNLVLAECDAIDAEVYGQHDEDDDGKREATARIRSAVERWRSDIARAARTTPTT